MIVPRTETEQLVRRNIAAGDVMVLPHAAGQMTRRRIAVRDVIASMPAGEVVAHYPHDDEGPAILMLLRIEDQPLHVVWRIEAATAGPALLVTAYQPNPLQWSDDFRRRIGSR